MTSEIGVLVVHGIGVQRRETFAVDFTAAMDDRLERLGVARGAVAWEAGYWADILDPREEGLLARLAAGGDLDYVRLRRFFLGFFADAIAYRREPTQDADVYDAIHDRVLGALRRLRARLGGRDRPLVVLAHSLGSVIASNYVWDEQRRNEKARGVDAFERMETLAGFVTFGSPIPLFTLALRNVVSIAFPPPTLAAPLAAAARWLNFYDPDDVLGWPLKPLSPTYERAVTEDRAINVGGVLTSWNPLAHDGYWTDADLMGPTAELIRAVLLAASA
jgi:alpha-beta hydrolase superfamily lysophospholipase